MRRAIVVSLRLHLLQKGVGSVGLLPATSGQCWGGRGFFTSSEYL